MRLGVRVFRRSAGLRRNIGLALRISSVGVCVLLALLFAQVVHATVVGKKGPTYAVSGSAAKTIKNPTLTGPESKLWYKDGRWWGVLWDRTSGSHHIFWLDRSTANHKWVDSGVLVDGRNTVRVDALSAGSKLWVATHVYGVDGGRGKARLYRLQLPLGVAYLQAGQRVSGADQLGHLEDPRDHEGDRSQRPLGELGGACRSRPPGGPRRQRAEGRQEVGSSVPGSGQQDRRLRRHLVDRRLRKEGRSPLVGFEQRRRESIPLCHPQRPSTVFELVARAPVPHRAPDGRRPHQPEELERACVCGSEGCEPGHQH